jgi:hypothetical protein
MDINGKVILLMAEQTGQGKNGTWRKLEFVIETQSQYPKKVCFSIWGDKIDTASIKMGDDVVVSFDPESREYNGKWYTDLRAWKVVKGSGNNTNTNTTNNSSQENNNVSTNYNDQEIADDLPF